MSLFKYSTRVNKPVLNTKLKAEYCKIKCKQGSYVVYKKKTQERQGKKRNILEKLSSNQDTGNKPSKRVIWVQLRCKACNVNLCNDC